MSTRPQLDLALKQIAFARQYTHTLIDDLDDERWFDCPAGATTHVAWQVGHLAMAEYGLCLFRVRGRQPIDKELMTSAFRKQFSRGSQPVADPARNPPPSDIRAVLARIHQQVQQELAEYQDADLQTPVEEPYAVEATKLGAIYFCSAHEMLHAGQIGLLRRLLGEDPVR